MLRSPEDRPLAFSLMAKPSGPICNLDCQYCFYLEKEKLYPGVGKSAGWRMPDTVLEAYIRSYIESQEVPAVTFAWQGGEPTLLGLDFFRRAVELERKYAGTRQIDNSFQTNGVLINEEWARFLADNGFLVGISIDGPREIHDRFRRDRGGQPTFDRVMGAIELFIKHGVQFNTLTVLQAHNSQFPSEVYGFLKGIGSQFLQFIPVVERLAPVEDDGMLSLVAPRAGKFAVVTDWSVQPEQFGRFLTTVFDEWVRNDAGQVFVQLFDVTLEAWYGMEPSICIMRRRCGEAMIVEHNGDVYSCDHYVYPENRLGNLVDSPLTELVTSERQRQFGADKEARLPDYCRRCEFLFACNGECPKHRFEKTPDGQDGLNYLCSGYRAYFAHVAPYMEFMREELRAGRPPANVIRWTREQDLRVAGKRHPGRNDPCLCGSGRKFKKCCGRDS